AVSVDKAKAAAYALKAGQQALENLAPTEAVKYLADAVELVGDADTRERCEAMVGLGDAQRQAGDPRYRDTLLGAAALAARIGDADARARAVLATWRGMSALGRRDVELVAALERAAEALRKQDARRADILAELAAEICSTSPHAGVARHLGSTDHRVDAAFQRSAARDARRALFRGREARNASLRSVGRDPRRPDNLRRAARAPSLRTRTHARAHRRDRPSGGRQPGAPRLQSGAGAGAMQRGRPPACPRA